MKKIYRCCLSIEYNFSFLILNVTKITLKLLFTRCLSIECRGCWSPFPFCCKSGLNQERIRKEFHVKYNKRFHTNTSICFFTILIFKYYISNLLKHDCSMSAGQSADRLSRYLVKSINHSNLSVFPNCRGLMSRACSRVKF